MIGGNIASEEFLYVSFGYAVKNLGEAVVIKTAEMSVCHGDGGILERIQTAEHLSVGRAADLLVETLVDPVLCQTERFSRDLLGNITGILGIAADIQKCCAGDDIKAASSACPFPRFCVFSSLA